LWRFGWVWIILGFLFDPSACGAFWKSGWASKEPVWVGWLVTMRNDTRWVDGGKSQEEG
jgi:hypothetical protein